MACGVLSHVPSCKAIMGSVFHMLSRNEPYRELGASYFDERRRHYTVDRLLSRIEHLGSVHNSLTHLAALVGMIV